MNNKYSCLQFTCLKSVIFSEFELVHLRNETASLSLFEAINVIKFCRTHLKRRFSLLHLLKVLLSHKKSPPEMIPLWFNLGIVCIENWAANWKCFSIFKKIIRCYRYLFPTVLSCKVVQSKEVCTTIVWSHNRPKKIEDVLWADYLDINRTLWTQMSL